jgi:hypothetical protein
MGNVPNCDIIILYIYYLLCYIIYYINKLSSQTYRCYSHRRIFISMYVCRMEQNTMESHEMSIFIENHAYNNER